MGDPRLECFLWGLRRLLGYVLVLFYYWLVLVFAPPGLRGVLAFALLPEALIFAGLFLPDAFRALIFLECNS